MRSRAFPFIPTERPRPFLAAAIPRSRRSRNRSFQVLFSKHHASKTCSLDLMLLLVHDALQA